MYSRSDLPNSATGESAILIIDDDHEIPIVRSTAPHGSELLDGSATTATPSSSTYIPRKRSLPPSFADALAHGDDAPADADCVVIDHQDKKHRPSRTLFSLFPHQA